MNKQIFLHNILVKFQHLVPRILTKSEDINILVLGETGVGKSTWMNSIANYLHFNSLEDATRNNASDMKALIQSKFTHFHNNCENIDIQIGDVDDNEDANNEGKSATKYPREYSFEVDNTTVTFIDTPGIGDPEGIDEDKKNFNNILTFLTHFEKIHAVCILLKPNQSRLTVAFRFCVQELLIHLHKSLIKNMIFCFVHTRSTFYMPGDSFNLLNQLLKKNNIEIALEFEKNYFCFDNEAFRLLACLRNGVEFNQKIVKAYSESWSLSSERLYQMVDLIRKLPPHDTKNTVSINEARNIAMSLNKPMIDIIQLIEYNKGEIEKKKEELEKEQSAEEFEKSLEGKCIKLVTEPLDYAMTVCTHEDCITRTQVGEQKMECILYETVCHEKCTLKGAYADEIQDRGKKSAFKRCRAFKGLGNFGIKCSNCKHKHTDHMQLTYRQELVEEDFLPKEAVEEIKRWGTINRKKQELVNQTEVKVKELEYEKRFIMDSAVKFGTFMQDNAVIPYNDAFKDYLEMLIKEEENKVDRNKDNLKVEMYRKQLDLYENELYQLQEIIKTSSQKRVQIHDIFNMKKDLMNLKHYGKNLKDILGN